MSGIIITEPEVHCRVDNAPPPEWGPYVVHHAESTIYHDPRWATLMRDVYGNACFFLTAWRGCRCVGVLALVLQRSWMMGSRLCSLPYLDASGVLADDESASAALLVEAGRLMVDRHTKWIEIRQERPLPGDLPTRRDKLTMRLTLPAGSAVLMDSFRGKTRNQIRKALSLGMSVDMGGPERLADFHHVYTRTMRDLGSPPHSHEFFRRLMEAFGPAASVFVIRDGNHLVAAALVLEDARRVYVPWSGSDWRHGNGQANTMLFWSMLSACSERGVKGFDFGRSTRGSGTHVFKQKWSAAEVPLHWHYVFRSGQSTPRTHHGPVLKLAGACWRKLPLHTVRVLGPRIIRKVS